MLSHRHFFVVVTITPSSRFTEYQADIVKRKKEQFSKIAVFPCKLKMLPDHIYTRRDPIVAGVKVEVGSNQFYEVQGQNFVFQAGVIKCGTPLCVPSKEFIYLGICTSLQVTHTIGILKAFRTRKM